MGLSRCRLGNIGERMDYLMIVMVSDTEGDRELGTKISKE